MRNLNFDHAGKKLGSDAVLNHQAALRRILGCKALDAAKDRRAAGITRLMAQASRSAPTIRTEQVHIEMGEVSRSG